MSYSPCSEYGSCDSYDSCSGTDCLKCECSECEWLEYSGCELADRIRSHKSNWHCEAKEEAEAAAMEAQRERDLNADKGVAVRT